MRRNSKSDAVSSSQVRLEDAYFGGSMDTATEKLVATKEESVDLDLSESETGSLQEEAVTVRLVACKTATGKPNASSKSDHLRSPKAERIEWSHNLHMCPATVHHMEAVLRIVRKIYERGPDDPMDDLDVNMAMWSIFLNTTLQAACHLGQDYEANLRFVKNHLWNRHLFRETGKLTSDQKEVTGVSTIAFKDLTWMSTSLMCEKAYRITNAKVCVFSDSVLCGKNGR